MHIIKIKLTCDFLNPRELELYIENGNWCNWLVEYVYTHYSMIDIDRILTWLWTQLTCMRLHLSTWTWNEKERKKTMQIISNFINDVCCWKREKKNVPFKLIVVYTIIGIDQVSIGISFKVQGKEPTKVNQTQSTQYKFNISFIHSVT